MELGEEKKEIKAMRERLENVKYLCGIKRGR